MTDAVVRCEASPGTLARVHDHRHAEYLEAQFRLRCSALPVPDLPSPKDQDPKPANRLHTKEAAERLKADKALWAGYNQAVLVRLDEALNMVYFEILVRHMSDCLVDWGDFLPAALKKFQEPGFFDAETARRILDDDGLTMDLELRTFLEQFILSARRSA